MGKNIKMNLAGVRKLQKQMDKAAGNAIVEAEKAAARESTPEGKARAYCRVMKRHGLEANQREVAARFRAQMG